MPRRLEQVDVTPLLVDWCNGNPQALDDLIPVVYRELSRLAAGFLRSERPEHTLQTAALVHECYLRLIDQDRVQWHNRTHFFAIAARMMRRVLVDHARHHRYAKRGAGAPRVSLDEALWLSAERPAELVALDEALGELARTDPALARIVELRYFGGLSIEAIAETCNISTATVSRRWRIARAWLFRQLKESTDGC